MSKVTFNLTNIKSEAAKKAVWDFWDDKELSMEQWDTLQKEGVIRSVPKHIKQPVHH